MALKGKYEHQATKAALERLENRVKRRFAFGVLLILVGLSVQELVN